LEDYLSLTKMIAAEFALYHDVYSFCCLVCFACLFIL